MENARYKILLIEDNELDQMAFKRFIENNGIAYDCTVAGSVAEAKRILAENQFDIIISDHSLGDGTALDVLCRAASRSAAHKRRPSRAASPACRGRTNGRRP